VKKTNALFRRFRRDTLVVAGKQTERVSRMTVEELMQDRESAMFSQAGDLMFHMTHDPLSYETLMAFEGLDIELTEEDVEDEEV
jgi:hypothetical protein